MTVCKNIQNFSRNHERVADFFSLLAIVLLFGSIWATLEYHPVLLAWVQRNVLLNSTLLIAGITIEAFLVLGFLAVGSARFGGENEKCFGTFRRRRDGSPLDLFRIWINHMESVGKKHR
jgi:hypothetical protein